MKHPSKFPHPSKRKAKFKLLKLNPGDFIELCVKRDEILEADPTFCENVRSLYRRCATGKLAKSAVRSIQPVLVLAALRRAGLSYRHSRQLLLA